MLRDDLWQAIGMHKADYFAALTGSNRHEYLCIGCLERRLGRPLVAGDFEAGNPCNEPDDWDTPRLAAARARTA